MNNALAIVLGAVIISLGVATNGRYQMLYPGSSGYAIKMDTWTGRVWCIAGRVGVFEVKNKNEYEVDKFYDPAKN